MKPAMSVEPWFVRVAPFIAFVAGPFLITLGGLLIICVGFGLAGDLRVMLVAFGSAMAISFGALLVVVVRGMWLDYQEAAQTEKHKEAKPQP